MGHSVLEPLHLSPTFPPHAVAWTTSPIAVPQFSSSLDGISVPHSDRSPEHPFTPISPS